MKIKLTAQDIIDYILKYLEEEIETEELPSLAQALFGGAFEWDEKANEERDKKGNLDWFETIYTLDTDKNYYSGFLDDYIEVNKNE
jgi:hypothetical protein